MPNKLILISWDENSIPISATSVYNSLKACMTGVEQSRSSGLRVIDLDKELAVSAYNIPFHSIQVGSISGHKENINTIKLWNMRIKGITVFFEIRQKNGKNQFMTATINPTGARGSKKSFMLPLIRGIAFIDRIITGRKLMRKIKEHIELEREKECQIN